MRYDVDMELKEGSPGFLELLDDKDLGHQAKLVHNVLKQIVRKPGCLSFDRDLYYKNSFPVYTYHIIIKGDGYSGEISYCEDNKKITAKITTPDGMYYIDINRSLYVVINDGKYESSKDGIYSFESEKSGTKESPEWTYSTKFYDSDTLDYIAEQAGLKEKNVNRNNYLRSCVYMGSLQRMGILPDYEEDTYMLGPNCSGILNIEGVLSEINEKIKKPTSLI